ncbi:MAG: hypothetical protein JWQ49_1881 [Edaphobacter sp.]|nr:hypothetical protein [Edaphobacter sp.]
MIFNASNSSGTVAVIAFFRGTEKLSLIRGARIAVQPMKSHIFQRVAGPLPVETGNYNWMGQASHEKMGDPLDAPCCTMSILKP